MSETREGLLNVGKKFQQQLLAPNRLTDDVTHV